MMGALLYHGTSSLRLARMLEENKLRQMGSGPGHKVSLTPDSAVAQYWGCLSAGADRDSRNREPNGANAFPLVLVLDRKRLTQRRYRLTPYSDSDDGEYDWEQELACRRDIAPLNKFLVGIEPVPADRVRFFDERGTDAFRMEFGAWQPMAVAA
jgi:hypothetical protein